MKIQQNQVLAALTSNERPSNEDHLEPYGGNLYRPHKILSEPGWFWRCTHGNTGLNKNGGWVGCAECAKDDPDAYAKFEGLLKPGREGLDVDLHGKIMNIQVDTNKMQISVEEASKECTWVRQMEYLYKLAHRDARHAAAELVIGRWRKVE